MKKDILKQEIDLNAIILAAKKAGKIIRDYYFQGVEESFKNERSVVTRADLESEAILKQELLAIHNCAFYSEEEGGELILSGDQWVVDPLDGTENMTGFPPIFSVSVGLIRDGNPYLGVICDPIHNFVYSAVKGKGAYLNGKSIKVSDVLDLNKARVSFDFSSKIETRLPTVKIVEILLPSVRTFKVFGSPALSLAAIASGRLEIFFRVVTKPVDFIAGVCILKEAGGKVLDFSGEDWNLYSKTILAGSPEIIDICLPMIQ